MSKPDSLQVESLKAKYFVLVTEAMMLAGRSVSEVERLEMAETWFDYLGETVPATQLDAVFRRAVLDHTTPYAINAFEMQMAYRAIKAESQGETEEQYRKRMHRDCVRGCRDGYVRVGEQDWELCEGL